MFSLLISILTLGFIIFFHELGHFFAARRCGVGVVEFSIGMGPRLVSRVFGNTRYSLRLLPFGGSCMMVGEEFEENGNLPKNTDAASDESDSEKPDESEEDGVLPDGSLRLDGRRFRADEAFTSKKAWQRFLIIAAGPVFNFILAFLLSIVITQQFGYDAPVVQEVQPGMPASEAGVRSGDTVLSLNGEKVTVYRDIQLFLLANQREMESGMPVELTYRTAGGQKQTAQLIPQYAEDTQSYRLGLTFSGAYTPVKGLPALIKYSAYNVEFCIKSTVKSLQMIFAGKVSRDDVAGPVRMVAVIDSTVDTASHYGAWTVLMTLFDMIILISASLGAMNLLPVPALDGGQLLFILIELFFRRPVPRELIARINMIGMMLLLLLMFFILFNDLSVLFG